jgi:hypothetical protein
MKKHQLSLTDDTKSPIAIVGRQLILATGKGLRINPGVNCDPLRHPRSLDGH